VLWACTVCGYVHDEEDERPDVCPVCGAPGSLFRETLGDDPDPDSDEFGKAEEGLEGDLDDSLGDDLDDDA